MSFLFINKPLRLNNLKTKTAMNAKISVFVVCVEAIIYLLLYSLHDCTFKPATIYLQINGYRFKAICQHILPVRIMKVHFNQLQANFYFLKTPWNVFREYWKGIRAWNALMKPSLEFLARRIGFNSVWSKSTTEVLNFVFKLHPGSWNRNEIWSFTHPRVLSQFSEGG